MSEGGADTARTHAIQPVAHEIASEQDSRRRVGCAMGRHKQPVAALSASSLAGPFEDQRGVSTPDRIGAHLHDRSVPQAAQVPANQLAELGAGNGTGRMGASEGAKLEMGGDGP